MKNLQMEREEVEPFQLKKRKIKRGPKIVELCQNRTLVEEIFVKKTMCTQYNQYFISFFRNCIIEYPAIYILFQTF